jgi:6-phosphofructokinase 1
MSNSGLATSHYWTRNYSTRGGNKIKKIAILTGGGDCPGLNPVIRGVVKTAIEKYGLEVVGIKKGYHGLYHKDFIPLTLTALTISSMK